MRLLGTLLVIQACLWGFVAAAATQSLIFNGANTYATIPSTTALGITTRFTAEFWFKLHPSVQTTDTQCFIDTEVNPFDGWFVNKDAQDRIIFGFTKQCVASASSWSRLYWNHVTVTAGPGGSNMYINGTQVCQADGVDSGSGPPAPYRTSSTSITLGRNYNNVYFRGEMADVRIWTVERNDADIALSQTSRLFSPATQPGLAAYYSLAGGRNAPVSVGDASGNGRTMFIQNGVWSAVGSGPNLVLASVPCSTTCTAPYKLDTCYCRCTPSPGYGIRFDGVKDFALADLRNTTFGCDYGISMWAYLQTAFTATEVLIDTRGAGYQWDVVLQRTASTTVQLLLSSSSGLLQQTATITTGAWHHFMIIGSCTGNQQQLYIDGTAQASLIGAQQNTVAALVKAHFGVRYLEDQLYLTGSLDEIRIWNTSVSPSLVSSIMKNRLASVPTPQFQYAVDRTLCPTLRTDSVNYMTFVGARFMMSTAPIVEAVVTRVIPNCMRTNGAAMLNVRGVNMGNVITVVHFGASQVLAQDFTSQNQTDIIAQQPSGGISQIVDVTVTSDMGDTVLSQGFLFSTGNGGTVNAVTPFIGPRVGGSTITISGSMLGSGTDITFVSLCGLQASIIGQSVSTVTVVSSGAYSGIGDIIIRSACMGQTTKTGSYKYNVSPLISYVTPSSAELEGGDYITISGVNLSNGTDVTAVTLNGIPVEEIISVDYNEVVVMAAASQFTFAGDVVVYSVSFGAATLVDSFQYGFDPGCPRKGAVVKGTIPNNGPYAGNNIVTIIGTQLGTGDVTVVTLVDKTASIIAQDPNSTYIIVKANQQNPNIGFVVVQSKCSGTAVLRNGYRYNSVPQIYNTIPPAGPAAGGSQVTVNGVNLGTGADVTEITLNGQKVRRIVSQSSARCQAIVIADNTTTRVGLGAAVTKSVSYGSATAANVWRYWETINPDCPGYGGSISGISPSNGPWDGGNRVTITGNFLGNGSDITQVNLRGVKASKILSQTNGTIVVVAGSTGAAGTGDIEVWSRCFGYSTTWSACGRATGYTYNNKPQIWYAIPRVGDNGGGEQVTIYGYYMNNGADLLAMELAGTRVRQVFAGYNHAVIRVITQNATAPNTTYTGDLRTSSTYYGNGTLSQGWKYKPYDANCPESGAKIFNIIPNQAPGVGGKNVTIIGSGLGNGDVTLVTLRNVRATIFFQNSSVIVVRANGVALGQGNVYTDSICGGPAILVNGFQYMPDYRINYVVPAVGYYEGGYSVTLIGKDLGNGLDVISVSIRGYQATILSQGPDQVIVRAGYADCLDCRGDVVVNSISQGTSVLIDGFLYYTVLDTACPGSGGVVSSVSLSGPAPGGNIITVVGEDLSNGDPDDVFSVTYKGVGSTLISASETSVVAIISGFQIGLGDVVIRSRCFGTTIVPAGYRYNRVPYINLVLPSAGLMLGGFEVTLTGTDLGNGTDITQVWLNGVAVQEISYQSDTVVIVRAANGECCVGTGDVVIASTAFGNGTLRGAFRYFATVFAGCPGFGGVITRVVPDNGPQYGGNHVTIIGTSLNNGTDIQSVKIRRMAAAVVWYNQTHIVAIPSGPQTGLSDVLVQSYCFGTTLGSKKYLFNYGPLIQYLTPASGDFGGGDVVTITGSNFGSGFDITRVTLCGFDATVMSQDVTSVTVSAGSALTDVTGDVKVYSVTTGIGTLVNGFRYYTIYDPDCPGLGALITAVTPNNGPRFGGNVVTVTGTTLGTGTDITTVNFGTLPAPQISQSKTQVVAVMKSQTSGSVSLLLQSQCWGSAVRANAYKYNEIPKIKFVTPTIGLQAGNFLVTIVGTNLGSGTDVTDVQLCGTTVSNILSQTSTSIIVRAAASTYNGWGQVTTTSLAFGNGLAVDSFKYQTDIDPDCPGTGANLTSITPTAANYAGGDRVTITGINLGSLDITQVLIAGIPLAVLSQTPTTVVGTLQPAPNEVNGNVLTSSVCYGTSVLSNAFTYCPTGSGNVSSMVPAAGPAEGGQRVTINGFNLGNGNDINNVTLCGIPGTIVSQGRNTVVLTTPNVVTYRVCNITIGSPCMGVTSYANGYTFNQVPTITTVTPASGSVFGGYTVTIDGTFFSLAGTEVTSVTLCGVGLSITSQSPSRIIGQVVAASVDSTGDVIVRSSTTGTATKVNAFSYVYIPPVLSGTGLSASLSLLQDTTSAVQIMVGGSASTLVDVTVSVLSGMLSNSNPSRRLLTTSSQLLFSGTATTVNTQLSSLMYIPPQYWSGTDTLTVTARDQSHPSYATRSASVSVLVLAVNHAPTFNIAWNQSTYVPGAVVSIASYATGISAGPGAEISQTLNWLFTIDNTHLFTVQPTLDSSGKLQFTLGSNIGIITMIITLYDNGGTANGGADRTSKTVMINVNNTSSGGGGGGGGGTGGGTGGGGEVIDPGTPASGGNTAVLAGGAAGGVIVVAAVIVVICCCVLPRWRKRKAETKLVPMSVAPTKLIDDESSDKSSDLPDTSSKDNLLAAAQEQVVIAKAAFEKLNASLSGIPKVVEQDAELNALSQEERDGFVFGADRGSHTRMSLNAAPLPSLRVSAPGLTAPATTGATADTTPAAAAGSPATADGKPLPPGPVAPMSPPSRIRLANLTSKARSPLIAAMQERVGSAGSISSISSASQILFDESTRPRSLSRDEDLPRSRTNSRTALLDSPSDSPLLTPKAHPRVLDPVSDSPLAFARLPKPDLPIPRLSLKTPELDNTAATTPILPPLPQVKLLPQARSASKSQLLSADDAALLLASVRQQSTAAGLLPGSVQMLNTPSVTPAPSVSPAAIDLEDEMF